VTEILPAAEAAQLAQHETAIERGIKAFYEVGSALTDIRDRKLYRAEYGTFEEYAAKRWGMSRSHAYRMIEAAGVVSPIGDTGLPLPSNEGQARELSRVPETERAAVWAATIERTDGKPTAAAVRDTWASEQPPALAPAADPVPAMTAAEARESTDKAKAALQELVDLQDELGLPRPPVGKRIGFYEVHWFLQFFPWVTEPEFAAIVDSIKRLGLLSPITLTHDRKTLVDGRIRYLACQEAGVEPRFKVLGPHYTEPMLMDYIVDLNLMRQSLTPDQRAMAQAQLGL
jgi:hypothetical protein